MPRRDRHRWTVCADRRQLLHLFLGGSEGGEADLLRELREGRVEKERHVTQQLMAAISAAQRTVLHTLTVQGIHTHLKPPITYTSRKRERSSDTLYIKSDN